MEAAMLNLASNLLYGAIVFLAGYGFSALKGVHRDKKAMQNGLQALLRDDILKIRSNAIKQQCISYTQKENVDRMYKAYSELGGNGTIKKLMPALEKLQVYTDIDDVDSEGEEA